MKKLFYPAIFHKAEAGGFWITFPDIPECMTQGDDMQHAYEMAVEALGLSITSMDAEGVTLPWVLIFLRYCKKHSCSKSHKPCRVSPNGLTELQS